MAKRIIVAVLIVIVLGAAAYMVWQQDQVSEDMVVAELITGADIITARPTPAGAQVYVTTPNQEVIRWTGSKIGGTHWGIIPVKTASLYTLDGQVVGGSFSMDMTALQVDDLEGDQKSDLEGHLQGEGFFAVANYPTSNFVIHQVEQISGNQYRVIGDLTIKDVTNQIAFPANITVTEDTVMVETSFHLDRYDRNISEMPKIISQYLGISFTLEAQS